LKPRLPILAVINTKTLFTSGNGVIISIHFLGRMGNLSLIYITF